METYIPDGGIHPVKAWVSDPNTHLPLVPFEQEARLQVQNISKMPFVFKHIAIMPDVHWGKGATVGSVIATKGAVIPAAVGVDIGCGMMAQKLDIKASQLPDNLLALRTAIERAVPHGRTDNGGSNDRGAWGSPNQDSMTALVAFDPREGSLFERYKRIVDKHPKIAHDRMPNHVGTLGTGNHFIELCLDENQDVWVMLHSGSRGVGNKVGTYFIEKAKEEMRRFFINLPDVNLAYLPEGTTGYEDYVEAIAWAQDYARLNREVMMRSTLTAVSETLLGPGKSLLVDAEQAVQCHHNYLTRERHFGENVLITRKGAVCAREGMLGIIPGSMGAKSFIVRGKGNRDSFTSCSHGAGRRMSRTEAKKTFTLEDHARATAGVECRKDKDVIDETPDAYKSIDAVMAAQSDLVDVVHTLKQVLVVKG